jgi:hypothetical protein
MLHTYFWQIGTNVSEVCITSMFRIEIALTLTMVATDSSKMSVPIYQITQCHVPEDSNLNIHWRENLKFDIIH